MRRYLFWHLPVSLAAVAAVIFAWGMYTALAGGAGESVEAAPTPAVQSPPAGELKQILILGDSLARGAGDESGRGIGGNLEDVLTGVEVVNLGIDGARTVDLLGTIKRESIRTIAAQSQAIVISIGGNDLFRESRNGTMEDAAQPQDVVDDVRSRVRTIITTMREESPGARIFLIGLYDPFREPEQTTARAVAIWNAGLTEEFAFDPRVTVVQTSDLFVDHDRLSRDRFHPGERAYAIIARRIADSLRDLE